VRFKRRWASNGEILYLVKWLGYPLEDSTWEPNEHLCNCQEAIRDYWLRPRSRVRAA